ncbi:FAD-dependent oxidoreductase [Archangium violaceum]|uniref:FAD-dependent oxidoreductase n=1 Tax=Archangium violaceum TaxID=83451 RepID=UPI001EF46B37|nr:FAD-dependent monooxygenase [Archangium violaceum]
MTLLGDASHLMLPSGEGANLAMYDGAELGKAIAAHPNDVEAALAEYETALFPRAVAVAIDGDRLHKALRDDDAPRGFLDLLTGHAQN